jgi:hypothetical protein
MPPKGPVPPSSVANVGNSIQFHEYFAADLSVEQAAFMAQSQVSNAFGDVSLGKLLWLRLRERHARNIEVLGDINPVMLLLPKSSATSLTSSFV